MRRFLKAWKIRGNERRFGSRIVNYADDFVILCRKHPAEALAEAQQILERIGLTLNQTKTRICHARREPFDFLGYSFGVQYRFGSGQSSRPGEIKTPLYLSVSPGDSHFPLLPSTISWPVRLFHRTVRRSIL